MNTEKINNEKIIDTLNDLIHVCKDSEEGYRQAAENVHNAALKRELLEESSNRRIFKQALELHVMDLGGIAEDRGTLAGALGRAWLGFKTEVGVSDQSILASLESDEDKILDKFKNALAQPLPADLFNLIKRSYASIKEMHDRIRMLRDSGQFKTKTA